MKHNPYRYAFGAILLALVVACSGPTDQGGGETPQLAPQSTPQVTLDAAMQADRDFAAMARKEGLQPAFLKYMHPTDSTFVQPGAVIRGAEAIAAGFASSPPDFMVSWTPEGGHGAASGDLAVTTGAYTITIGPQTIETGRYVTVWSRDAAGDLKVVHDMTAPDAAPAAPPPPEAGDPG